MWGVRDPQSPHHANDKDSVVKRKQMYPSYKNTCVSSAILYFDL